jgi:hypothetical protein
MSVTERLTMKNGSSFVTSTRSARGVLGERPRGPLARSAGKVARPELAETSEEQADTGHRTARHEAGGQIGREGDVN